ncbi:hypothetical protein LZ198_26760 [Myxococcus sp. K15C18031901]|uniref:hypothetical protein n=1 Tax=Myxococcus dinghuensis TaxID=2906761 RepID=UPI0020A6E1D1|nr:hypothetical protein [Myxococcus dinghuensis]MCP3102480.1 hypothetical protein [Myxococcus dinghuensis]
MSVRWPQNVPRPGVPTRSPQDEVPREKEKPGESKSSGKATAKGGKAPAGGKGKASESAASGGSQGAGRQEGLESGGQRGAADGMDSGGQRGAEGLFPGGPGAGEGTSVGKAPSAEQTSTRLGADRPTTAPAAQAQVTKGQLGKQAPTVAPQTSQEGDAAEQDAENLARAALEGRARLRAAVVDRLMRGLTEVEARLSEFLANPGRQGVVTLPLVLSESSVANEFWQMAHEVPDDRGFLAQTLGLPVSVDDAPLLQMLREEVHAAFDEFLQSAPGKQVRASYEAVLARYEAARVQPVIAGHDTGPLVEVCARLQLPCEPDFTRSLLLSPLQLAVALSPEEGTEQQVMVAGLTVTQLGSLVAHLRQLNPMLSNAQVRQLLLRAATDLKKALRKPLGDAEVERVQALARQLLRLQAVEMLFV